jgi:hypothetical protein
MSPSQQEPVMKRILSLVGAISFVVVALVFALQAPMSFPPLDWAKKSAPAKPRVAVLLEFGQKDINLRDWSGQATIAGAKVVQREGYRFHPQDKLTGADGWTASTHRPVRAPAGMPAITKLEPVATVGVVLHLEDVQADAKISIALKTGEKADVPLSEVLAGKTIALWNGTAVARLLTTASPVAIDKTEDDFPAAAYGPDGTLWVAYIRYKHRDEGRRLEAASIKEQPKDFKAYYKPQFADQLFVKSCKDGKWSEPIALTDANKSITRCAIAVDGNGNAHVVFSHGANGQLVLTVAVIDSSGKVANKEAGVWATLAGNTNGSVLTPVMATDAAGNVWLAAQSWSNGEGAAKILVMRYARGRWELVTDLVREIGLGNSWHPSIAVSPKGTVAVAYDVFRNGSYDIHLTLYDAAKPGSPKHVVVAASPKFEARPSIVYDATGRLWIAYEEGPENWGKDYGSLVTGKGNPLYSARSVRVVCLDTDGKLKRPTAELPTSTVEPPAMAGDAVKTNLFERASRYAYPKIGLDGEGRVWLTYRRNFGSRYSSHPGAYWLTYARRLDGQAWSEPIEVHHSDGLLDHRPVLLPHAGGGLLIVHNTDGRYTTPNDIDNQIYAGVLDLPAKATALQLVDHQPGSNPVTPELAAENAAVKRMREHRIKAGGKTYQFLRGEYHRHTEISWDGAPDGSLEDMFRYAIDAVQFDWIGNGDHDNGAGREYPWWLTQKLTDAYQTKAFTTMFTYERSVAYPHGHRNVMFAQRGILTLPRLAPPAGAPPVEEGKKKGAWPGGVHPDDAKMLYRYLHEFNGICASHTSATGMGTDWRDNDPVVEPIVEIYQGDRMSYEMEGAPRAGFDPQSGKTPANVAGWYPKGYVNLALQKGYKLAFQASSDHWSTHISFFIILAEGRDRQSLLKAVQQRHCYAATDNILVDFRSGDAIMGDGLVTKEAPKFQIHVVGTANLAKIDIMRDSEVVATLTPGAKELKTEWTDPKAAAGSHYYYVRALQTDQEIAWGTPIWVELKK